MHRSTTTQSVPANPVASATEGGVKLCFPSFNPRRWKKVAVFGAIAVAVSVLLLSTVRINLKGHFDGLFLLRGENGWLYEISDDLYAGDGERLIHGFDFEDPQYRLSLMLHGEPKRPSLYYEWDTETGAGYIRNFLPDGGVLFTSFARYKDDDKKEVNGLFVGGTLPANVISNDNVFMNESGMAYNDGSRWYHIWCNVNEGIISPFTRKTSTPSSWEFLGSKIIDADSHTLALSSAHRTEIDGVPLRVDRYAYFHAGDPYFILTVKVTNIGTSLAHYYYVYGDEPWTGNYGTSRGNVGWVEDRLVEHETNIDSRKYSYAGMFDYGNSAIGEGRNFTGAANFIEWLGNDKPDVYFANDGNGVSGAKEPLPLSSNTRFIGLQWGPKQLAPGRSASYQMAIGMAGHDPRTGLPVKPVIRLKPEELYHHSQGLPLLRKKDLG
ncbi:hypothetical protein [Geobacter sp. DSM 9736]|uniref:hypothetical protein n=1 Tax=Geobacter sp. DSM 9736 TaxID=1277350 RepID=UPI000B4FFB78|nr:hypothetical protein [Geobacter sp. DSM 9736]SNB46709.1 hypothetical protein SAMN06269301_2179 [Geobacter sp. DSM 9736]